MLEIDKLQAGYGENVVAELPRLELARGEHCLLLGASGSGKTTLLCTLAGFLTPISGVIRLNGTEVSGLHGARADKFRSRHMGFIFQTLHMVNALSVLDNLLLVRFAAGLPQEREIAEGLLEKLGLVDKRHEKPQALSQGQQQRVAIARAVINNPAIILGDEPTSALDDRSCDRVMELLLDMTASVGASLVTGTHDQRITGYFPRQIVLGGAP
jgi:putative ABC transport system ATP-binding protein